MSSKSIFNVNVTGIRTLNLRRNVTKIKTNRIVKYYYASWKIIKIQSSCFYFWVSNSCKIMRLKSSSIFSFHPNGMKHIIKLKFFRNLFILSRYFVFHEISFFYKTLFITSKKRGNQNTNFKKNEGYQKLIISEVNNKGCF